MKEKLLQKKKKKKFEGASHAMPHTHVGRGSHNGSEQLVLLNGVAQTKVTQLQILARLVFAQQILRLQYKTRDQRNSNEKVKSVLQAEGNRGKK
jgi:hypothetical protein